jgi:signal transduction histidine kinase
VIISVKDNGVGITQEESDKLFKIDGVYSTLGTQQEKGTGLGLILCKEFLEKNKGKIWVESLVNVGTAFYFSLPANDK